MKDRHVRNFVRERTTLFMIIMKDEIIRTGITIRSGTRKVTRTAARKAIRNEIRNVTRLHPRQRSLTAARKQMVSWKCFRMDTALSAAKIICREKMISMFRRPRSAASIWRPAISWREASASRHRVRSSVHFSMWIQSMDSIRTKDRDVIISRIWPRSSRMRDSVWSVRAARLPCVSWIC